MPINFPNTGTGGGGGGSALTVKNEGTNLDTAVTSIDLVGAGVLGTNSGHAVTVTIPGAVSDILANRPAAAPANGGEVFYATDVDLLYVSDGSTWTTATLDHGTGLTGLSDDDHPQYVLRSILTTRGDLFVRDGSGVTRLGVGANARYLRSDGTDPSWHTLDAADLNGAVAIANGGTGQTTKAAGYDALNPNTTRGDITYRGAANNVRLGIGTAGKFLKSDGTDPGWATITNTDVSGLGAYATRNTAIDIQYFSASGTGASGWQKPAAATATSWTYIRAIAAGGQGGGGARRATGAAGGGGGGQGGCVGWEWIKTTLLGATEDIAIGAGGTAAGAGGTTDTSNGNSGGGGGDTTFGTSPNFWVTAKGGGGGSGGTATGGGGGNTGVGSPFQGATGGTGSIVVGAPTIALASGLNANTPGGGGGGGGGINGTGGTGGTGGQGAAIHGPNGGAAGGTGGSGAVSAGPTAATNANSPASNLTDGRPGGGGGGGGGGSNNAAATPSNGATGGTPGGGGGGAGAGVNTFCNGATGGNGGNGGLIAVTIL